MNTKSEFLQGYIFHYNPYTQMWAGIKREHTNEYFNATIKEVDIVKAPDINIILEYLKGLQREN